MSKVHDLIIIGSGPAAMSAASYAGRDKKSPQVFEKGNMGGLVSIISQIDNYPGFMGEGLDLAKSMREQAESAGAKFHYGECTAIEKHEHDGANFKLVIDDCDEYFAKTVLVATGTERRKLGIPGEESARVSYCATCDAPLTRGEHVVVVGAGNSAVQESFHLLKYCESVTLLVRSKLSCDDLLQKRLKAEPRIHIEYGFRASEIREQGNELQIVSDEDKVIQGGHIFVFIGATASTAFLDEELLSDDRSIITDSNMMTSWPGLFAAGDCRRDSVHQVVTAAGEGAAAAIAVGDFLEK